MIAGLCRAALFAIALAAGPAGARDLIRPAELPPASYAGQQYVDSGGCLFMRAGTEAQVMWVARVNRDGVAVCGYPPSGARVPLGADPGASVAAGAAAGAASAVTPDDPDIAVAPPVSTNKATPKPAGTQGVLITVGSFAVAANADRAARAVAGLGLPVMQQNVTRSGTALVVIFAGPFLSRKAAGTALKIIKSAGYPEAVVAK